jgi:hypothetical protein
LAVLLLLLLLCAGWFSTEPLLVLAPALLLPLLLPVWLLLALL